MKALLIFAVIFYCLAEVCSRFQTAEKEAGRMGFKPTVPATLALK
jgi:hypothetical protein